MTTTKIKNKLVDQYVDQIIKDKYTYLSFTSPRESINHLFKCSYKIITPFDYVQIIDYCVDSKKHKTTEKELLSMISILEDFIKTIHYVKFHPINKKLMKKMIPPTETAFTAIRIATRYYLNPRFLETCHPDWLNLIMMNVEYKIREALYTPGKNIGTIIGQTLTAPLTQYLIDAHHKGAAGGTSREGLKYFNSIVSLKELSKLGDNEKRMYIYLKPKYEENQKFVTDFATYIISKPFVTFINKSQVLMEKYGEHITFPNDKKFHEELESNIGSKISSIPLYGLLFRYTLNYNLMKLKNTNIIDIVHRIEKHFNGEVFCTFSTKPISGELVMCMYFHQNFNFGFNKKKIMTVNKDITFWSIINEFRINFNNTFITNDIPNIKDALVKQKEIVNIEKDGSTSFKKIYFIQTNGIEYENILRINVVDKARTSCSSVPKTYVIDGFTAARDKCISEMSITFDTLSLIYNNFTFPANVIFEVGEPENLGEKGQKKREFNDVLVRMAAKDPVSAAAGGAFSAIRINVNSPTSNMICGQVPKIGTHYNQICYNPEFVKSYKNISDEDIL
jgi:DNA-directed RNA polymerase II subunit RPB1